MFLCKKPHEADAKINKIILNAKQFQAFLLQKIPPPKNFD